MGDSAGEQVTAVERPRWDPRRYAPKTLWWSGVAIVLAVAGLFGGLDRVDPAATTVDLQAGQEFAGKRFDVTVRSARLQYGPWGQDLPLRSHAASTVYLLVEATFVNHSDETAPPPVPYHSSPAPALLGARRPASTSFVDADAVVSADYPNRVSADVQPGLPARLWFVWSLNPGVLKPGDEVLVRVLDEDLVEFGGVSREGVPTRGRTWVITPQSAVYRLTVEGR